MAKLIDKNNLTTLSASFSLVRTSPQPIDPTSVWYSFVDAEAYAKTDNAFVGQHLTVVENGLVSEYVIVNESGALILLARGHSIDDGIYDEPVLGDTIIEDKSDNYATDLDMIEMSAEEFYNENVSSEPSFSWAWGGTGPEFNNAKDILGIKQSIVQNYYNPWRCSGIGSNRANVIKISGLGHAPMSKNSTLNIPPFYGSSPVVAVDIVAGNKKLNLNSIKIPWTARFCRVEICLDDDTIPKMSVAGNGYNSFNRAVLYYIPSDGTINRVDAPIAFQTYYDYNTEVSGPDQFYSTFHVERVDEYGGRLVGQVELDVYLDDTIVTPSNMFSSLIYKKRINTYDIYAVSESKFAGCDSIGKVNIQHGFKRIGAQAFSKCDSMKSITLPSTLLSIGSRAFAYCYALKEITIPKSVTEISLDAFKGCKITVNFAMTEEEAKSRFALGFEYDFGASEIEYVFKVVKQVSYSLASKNMFLAYADATYSNLSSSNSCLKTYAGNVKKFQVPYVSGAGVFVKYIGAFAFKDNIDLEFIELPYTLCRGAGIEYYRGIFSGCHSLNTIKFYEDKDVKVTVPSFFAESNCLLWRNGGLNDPEGATEFYHSVVAGCAGSVIPESANLIEPYAFHKLNGIEELIIPSHVKKISEYAYADCINLSNLTLSEGVEIIEDFAFQNCTSLNKVTLPSTITEMGLYTFDGCDNVSVISVNWKKDDSRNAYAPWGATNATLVFSEDEVVADTIINGIIYQLLEDDEGNKYYCVSGVDPITVTSPAVDLESEISGVPVTTVAAYAFAKNLSSEDGRITIDEIICPDSVVKIMEYAFAGFNGIIGIRASGMSYLGEDCFYSAKLTVGLMYGDTLGLQFYNFPDTGVEDIVVMTKPTTIPEYAFANVKTLKTINFRNKTVTTVSGYAFKECYNLTSITGLENVTTVGEHAFYHCTAASTIDVDYSLTTIGNYAFYMCSSFVYRAMPISVGEYAFYNCKKLTRFDASRCTSIGDYALAQCTSLTEFYMDVVENNAGTNYEDGTLISFGNNWDSETGDYTVIFPDGVEISKSEFTLSSEYSA
ncbi:MAG: leucine-rich repeat domain-containing protein [Clostridia bacterium]|nr:leucine-rich repeat domain-containing protein [Clostridia bacterium]